MDCADLMGVKLDGVLFDEGVGGGDGGDDAAEEGGRVGDLEDIAGEGDRGEDGVTGVAGVSWHGFEGAWLGRGGRRFGWVLRWWCSALEEFGQGCAGGGVFDDRDDVHIHEQ